MADLEQRIRDARDNADNILIDEHNSLEVMVLDDQVVLTVRDTGGRAAAWLSTVQVRALRELLLTGAEQVGQNIVDGCVGRERG